MKKTLFKRQGPYAEKKTRRPPWIPPDLKEVEALARLGLSDEEIALALDIHKPTLRRKKRAWGDFNQAVEKGRALGIAAVASSLYHAAVAGKIRAIIFYLKTVGHWGESHFQVKTDAEERRDQWIQDQEETMKQIRALTRSEREVYLKLVKTAEARVRDGIVPPRELEPLPPEIAALEVKDAGADTWPQGTN
jgi:hypothetical protein